MAKKCTTCNEYQNPAYRWLSGNVLSGLIALIPICTLAFTFVYDRLEPQASDLQFTLTRCDAKQIAVFASNLGNRAAILTHAEFSSNGSPYQPLHIRLDIEKKLIDGSDTRAIELRTIDTISPGGLVPFAQRQTANCSITIRLHSVSFAQKTSFRELTCACPSL
ncbi:hypothetical protein [Rheinheimera maricola]|uniref:DUF3426 domain-containing protein n=1 Tax=Rheinheimera maricola TaxID=2793282 RepID=A0ABS7X4S0_9GAMM|nr:hypothetical protein [Rheinheimera maricola]MBZ9610540.1 hypothetical protein [Rheinheimera maricola]